MVVKLAEHLDVPLRERNELLLAAGYAPAYPETSLEDAEMGQVREVVGRLLAAHEPYPAVAVDRRWELVDGNAGVAADHRRRRRPPAGAADQRAAPEPASRGHGAADRQPRRVARHVLGRLRREVGVTQDPQLRSLLAELEAYPGDDPDGERRHASRARARSSSRCACATSPANWPSCRRSRPSARRWTSRSPSCRSRRSSRPTRTPRRSCARWCDRATAGAPRRRRVIRGRGRGARTWRCFLPIGEFHA